MNPDDTIVAVSSPPGSGVRGIIRLSGPEAARIVDSFFRTCGGERIEAVGHNQCLEGRVMLGDGELPGRAYVFKTPRSYTRQDMVELHVLGAPGVLGLLVECCLGGGARPAEPGEFTARAFLAGRFDLSQVHGVAGMIAARSDQQLRAAERLLHGELARTAERSREELAELLSLVEGALDFADEPIEFIAAAELRRRLAVVRESLGCTAAAGLRAERWEQLPRVLLAGPPNAGKSSLLNRLTGIDRALCAPIAGTTRDVLSAPVQLGQTECLLMDAAGLTLIGGPAGELQGKAEAAAREAIKDADLIVYVVDIASTDLADAAIQARATAGPLPCLLVANKCDLIPEDRTAEAAELGRASGLQVCTVSAATGAGEEMLKKAVEDALSGGATSSHDPCIALMAEHRDALGRALQAIDAAMRLAGRSGRRLEETELVAAELHSAAEALGTLVGEEDVEDLLGRIFSRFCIGK
jgi:tRNA modification GTPase